VFELGEVDELGALGALDDGPVRDGDPDRAACSVRAASGRAADGRALPWSAEGFDAAAAGRAADAAVCGCCLCGSDDACDAAG